MIGLKAGHLAVYSIDSLFRYCSISLRQARRMMINPTSRAVFGLRVNLSRCLKSIPRLPSRSYSQKVVPLTKETYPSTVRNQAFASLGSDDIGEFKKILSDKNVLTDASDLEFFNEDWMRKYRGESKCVLKPQTTEQVSQILKYCNEKKIAVVPQGGNTGLVGGSVPVFDEVILSLANMNKIRSFDNVSGIFKLDAGVILEIADQYLAEQGYIFPLDLGPKAPVTLVAMWLVMLVVSDC